MAFFYFFAKQKNKYYNIKLQHEITKTTTKKRQSNANRVINNNNNKLTIETSLSSDGQVT